MKRAGSTLSLFVGCGLLATAGIGYVQDQQEAAERIRTDFAELNSHDYSGLEDDLRQERDAKRTMGLEALCGAGFLVAGFGMWGRRPKPEEHIG